MGENKMLQKRKEINENYRKKFSFGLSLNIALEDYEKIIEKYSEYLNSVYFSLPFGNEFHTRKLVIDEYNQENAEKKLIKILKLFKKNGIKLEAVINQYHIEIKKLKEVLYKLDEMVKVDSICCLNEYVDVINNHYSNKMYVISSFNNGSFKFIDDETYRKYDMVVLAKEYMRKPKTLEKIRNNGIDIKLLVNNGCAFNCKSCRAGQKECINTFLKNVKKYTPEELYAMQSFFPWELEELFDKLSNPGIVKEIKISSRPSSYKYIRDCLESYLYSYNVEEYINENPQNYHLWGRQANLIEYFDKFDLKNIERIKRKLWEQSDEKNNYL